jgi:hypothetical protein
MLRTGNGQYTMHVLLLKLQRCTLRQPQSKRKLLPSPRPGHEQNAW